MRLPRLPPLNKLRSSQPLFLVERSSQVGRTVCEAGQVPESRKYLRRRVGTDGELYVFPELHGSFPLPGEN